MGYYIRPRPDKKSEPRWKIQFVSHKKEHTSGSAAKSPKRTWNIPRERWSGLGFRASMTLEEARARQRQLNAQRELELQEERRQKIEEAHDLFSKKCAAYLPEIYMDEFETRYLLGRFREGKLRGKTLSHWNAARKAILEVGLEPQEWYDEAHRFYDYFHARQFSYSYLSKIRYIINQWGFFLSRKLGTPFFPVPRPKGYEKTRLLDAYFEKLAVKGTSHQSDPISPKQLKMVRHRLKRRHYNWLYLSVWLGLRPFEIDQLKESANARFQSAPDGTPILWVYQTKLASVPPRYRWKLIPLICREQKRVREILRTRDFDRPLVKTVRRYFGPHTSLYGGRKGFTDLMMSRNQSFDHISQWMGHSTIQRTWASYKDRRQVHYARGR